MTSLEGRVLRRRRAVPPRTASATSLRSGRPGRACSAATCVVPHRPGRVLDELRRASAGGIADYCGISRTPRRGRGAVLAVPRREPTPGTPRMFLDRFGTPDGRAVMRPVAPTAVADDVRPDAPLYLITGRVLQHYQSGRADPARAELLEASPHSYVQINPLTAGRLGIAEGDPVEVTSSRGSCVAPARLIRRHPPGGGVHAVPLSRARSRPTPSPTQPPTRSAGCPSSRCARSGSGREATTMRQLAEHGFAADLVGRAAASGRRARQRHGVGSLRRQPLSAAHARPGRAHRARRGVRSRLQPAPAGRGRRRNRGSGEPHPAGVAEKRHAPPRPAGRPYRPRELARR